MKIPRASEEVGDLGSKGLGFRKLGFTGPDMNKERENKPISLSAPGEC